MIGLTAFILTASVTRADPISLDGGNLIAFPIVALFALAVEAAVVALLLTLRGMAPVPLFIAYFFTNVAVFILLLISVVFVYRIPLAVFELFAIIADGLCIKLLSGLEIFQGDEFQNVSWLRSMVISCVGNAISYFAGAAATRLF